MNAVTWLGHSTTVIDVDGTRIVTDPVLERRIGHLSRRESVSDGALGAVAGVLISHVHLDHLDFRSLARCGCALPVVVPRGAGSIVRRRGFRHVLEVEAGEEIAVGSVRVQITPAEHGVVRRYVRAQSTAIGFVVRGSTCVYFAGDTDLFLGMAVVGRVDVALLPIGGWGPRLPSGHLDPERAALALTLIRPNVVIPVHWGTYHPFYSAPDDAPARKFVRAARKAAPSVDVRVLRQGETFNVEPNPPEELMSCMN